MLGARPLLLPAALLALIVSHCALVDAHPYDFLDNYRNPPPSPQDGPPASAHASRDKNLLPAQICGIVGGYVVTVLIWGILLLTVGRRMRRKIEASGNLELELVTKRTTAPTSPISARSATSWTKRIFKKERGPDSPSATSPTSPVVNSPTSFDQAVLDADRERANLEMERLYAAVMDHDRKKSLSSLASDNEPHQRRPSAINTSHLTTHSNPSSPVKAIYPPGFNQSGPPTAPLPREQSRLRDEAPPASPRSILSKKSHTSVASSSSKTRFNLKNLRISGPVQKYPHDRDEEARTPLSPRIYHPGAPPSPPSMHTSPTTPATMEEAYEQLDEPQPLPRPAPHRTASASSSSAPPHQHPALDLPPSKPRSATSSSTNLPLRGYAEPLKSPSLRTTVLDRRPDKLSMTTPKTGVPYTPYTPYMPFTPVTPVTPHLVTKKERKAVAKMGGRRAVQREEGMVQSPKEIFGDAW